MNIFTPYLKKCDSQLHIFSNHPDDSEDDDGDDDDDDYDDKLENLGAFDDNKLAAAHHTHLLTKISLKQCCRELLKIFGLSRNF